MRRGFFAGLFLIFLPVALLLLSSIPIMKSRIGIDTFFVVEPGEKREGYHEETFYHTNIMAYSKTHKLIGYISVEGEGIYFSSAHALKPTYVDHQYNFTIMDVIFHEQYFFSFDNTEGNNNSSVSFLLKEEGAEPLSLMGAVFGWYSVILLAPIGLIVLIVSFYKMAKDIKTSKWTISNQLYLIV